MTLLKDNLKDLKKKKRKKPLALSQLPEGSNLVADTMGSYGDKKKTKKKLDEVFDYQG